MMRTGVILMMTTRYVSLVIRYPLPKRMAELTRSHQEVLPVPSERSEPMIMVEYHILLSPGYQVPVLYFRTIAHASGVSLAVSLPDIYNLLVDTDSRTQVENIGVMGGISQSDHPIFGHPFYFVHPCNTADAMREWEGDEMTSERYLMIWLGLVGPVVGLFLPADAIR